MSDHLTTTERNALAWVQFIKYWDKLRAYADPDDVKFTLVSTRIAIQRRVLEEE